MKTVTFEAKTRDEAMKLAAEALRVQPEYIALDIEEKKSMLGFRKSYDVRATVDVNLAELGLNTLQTLFDNMGVEATIDMKQPADDEITYTINTNENPVLIGKNGKTLDGIQYYIRNLLNIFTDHHVMVLCDIGGYKENRKRQLEILATKTAKEVARTKVEAKLDPMNAYERRIIHTKLAEWRDVETKSVGEKPDRAIVIRPKNAR